VLIHCALAAALPGAATAGNLTDLSLEELMQVPVVGASKYTQQQQQIAAAVSVITREEIKAFGWRTIDQALASLPGVYTTYDRQYVYLGVRGFGLPGDYNTRVLVTVNGNRVNDPNYDTGPFGRQFPVDIDLIERIEFIPGPGGAVYGQNALFAVVNIVTRTGAQVHGAEVAADYQQPQSLAEGRASWGDHLSNGVDVLMSVSNMNAKGQNRFFNYGTSPISGVATGLDGDHNEQFFGSVARGPWSLELVYAFDHKDDPTGSYYSDPLVRGQYSDSGYTLTQLQYQDHFASDTLHVSARLFTGEAPADTNLSYGTMYGYPVWGNWWGTEAHVVSTALSAHTLMMGLEAQDNYYVKQSAIDFADAAYDYSLRESGYRAGVYGQDEWRMSNALAATLGLRLDRDDTTITDAKATTLSPRAALIWQAASDTTAKALYGVAHRLPNVFEDTPGFGVGYNSLGLGGETIETFELDVDHRLGRDLTLRASVYEWHLRDLIEENSITGEYQNQPPVETRGIEMSTDKTWDSGARVRDSISLQDADNRGGGWVVNSPKALGKVNFSDPLPVGGMRVGYELQYDSRRLTLDGTTLGGYSLSNLYLSAESLAKGLDLSLVLDNLFGKRYAQPASANNWQNSLEQDGRSVRIKLSYTF
jgi:iron complex outermembrane receptor protein